MTDRSLPRDTEAEREAVGVCMHNPALLPIVFATARPEHFYDELNRRLMLTIERIVSRNEGVAPFTVSSQVLRDWPDCEEFYPNLRAEVVSMYTGTWPVPESVAESIAQTIRQAADLRHAITTLDRAAQAAYDPSAVAQDIVDETVARLTAISGDRNRSISADTQQTLSGSLGREGVASEILNFLEEPGAIRGIRTGWTMFDQWLSGLMRTKVYTVIADTSVGKSIFVHWLAWMLSKNGYRSLLVSTEMDRNEVLWRLVGMEASVDFEGIKRRGKVESHERERINRALDALNTGNKFVICDVGGIELGAMAGEVKRIMRRDPVDVVFVDHIQHIQVKGVPSHLATARLEAVTAGIKAMAMNEDIPVMQVSHIPRSAAVAGYAGIHGGKGSSSIEQDSNVQMELSSVHWGQDPNTGEVGWIPFATEREMLQFQSKTSRHPIRIGVNKNRHGDRPWDVLVRDWTQGGRLMSPSEEDMR